MCLYPWARRHHKNSGLTFSGGRDGSQKKRGLQSFGLFRPFMLHRSRFCIETCVVYNFFAFASLCGHYNANTVTVLISQLLSRSNNCYLRGSIPERSFFFVISLQHADKKNADDNSLSNSNKLLQRKGRDTIPAQPHGQLRASSYVHTRYNMVSRRTIHRRRGEAAVYYCVCTYQ